MMIDSKYIGLLSYEIGAVAIITAVALMLAVHLGVVMALFLTLPYGKFAHAVYRCAALLKWSIEKRQPSTLSLGSD